MTQQVVLLGSTGSIGTQALQVIDQYAERFDVVALSAGGHSLELLAQQCVRYRPQIVGIHSDDVDELAQLIRAKGGTLPEILHGAEASTQIAGSFSEAVVLNGITGGVGLGPTLAALEAGATLALANKESLVVGGSLVRRCMRRPGQIVPVDSEHSAIAQCLESGVHEKGLTASRVTGKSEVAQLVLTASGGPFRGKKRHELTDVTPQQALAHPTWSMGPVVTINSSTLVNKGLELIEAHLLFDIPADDIVPVVHPQSIVHSMVTWKDGATIAQASPPDMKLPIALGLTWPERLPDIERSVDFLRAQEWTFEPVDFETFPALTLARAAVSESATHPAVYNAANEVFVQAFLDERLPYLSIVDLLAQVLGEHSGIAQPSVEDILGVEEWARNRAEHLCAY
ncbi:1-deoxy-D-xylulose-5-phosphate reductoisomerase [uncultured Actinomyces sp.]|uniref:1-deoxy-D-xylulose-5-phosphate reductoisomerase n=1 Tax=uncultured Actinomyces sp. TaxID=249061 RepID=UPI0028D05FF8|nr:1-deoxy-D-xylulose-5-phosphate reductoisomerase [uncultured Actinomyces sp.]